MKKKKTQFCGVRFVRVDLRSAGGEYNKNILHENLKESKILQKLSIMKHKILLLKNIITEAREMVLQLGALASPAEDPGLLLSTNMEAIRYCRAPGKLWKHSTPVYRQERSPLGLNELSVSKV